MRSIRGRLIGLLLGGLTVVLAAGGVAVYRIAEANLVRAVDNGILTHAQSLAALVTFDDGHLEFEFDQGRAQTIEDAFFEYREMDGAPLRSSETLADAPLPWPDDLGDEVVYADVTLPSGEAGRAIWMRFDPRIDPWYLREMAEDGVTVDPIVVVAATSAAPLQASLATLLAALLGVGAVVALTAGGLIAFGVHWGLAPLERLSRQLGRVDGETMSSRFDGDGAPRELGPIYRELNRMLDRVQVVLERERSFADAAAHELRTPLAELRTTAEVAVRWPDDGRPVAALSEILGIGREMEQLVESLLMLSRGHASAMDGAAEETPVAPIVETCVTRANGSIVAKHLVLSVDLDGCGLLRGPRDAVDVIVRNLVDNAVHYTPDRGTISIRGERRNGDRILVVENGPVALTDGDVSRLFEPFWRHETSRTDRSHCGLGLAVVQQVAQAIGMTIAAELDDDRLAITVAGET